MTKKLGTDTENGGVAQWLELSVVCGNVAGSSPVTLVFLVPLGLLFGSARLFSVGKGL